MGLRFRKSFKISKGVKVNLGKKSVGVSIGNKYAGVNINSKNGVNTRISVPKTGISYTNKLNKKGSFDTEDVITSEPASTVGSEPQKKKYNLFLDIILVIFTGGLWFLWILLRPKYEYK